MRKKTLYAGITFFFLSLIIGIFALLQNINWLGKSGGIIFFLSEAMIITSGGELTKLNQNIKPRSGTRTTNSKLIFFFLFSLIVLGFIAIFITNVDIDKLLINNFQLFMLFKALYFGSHVVMGIYVLIKGLSKGKSIA